MGQKGFVYLVGAGPGDKELITLRGMSLLTSCEVVVYDRLATEELLELVPSHCKKINVGKRVGNHSISQDQINQIIVKEALEGKCVVRLKGGDPFVFGRGGEEILALEKEGIGYQVVPGVTSAIAVPELAGIPVTHRGLARSFHVITGHTKTNKVPDKEQFACYAQLEGTLVFLMGVAHLEEIVSLLIEYGKEKHTPVAIIENGTTNEEKVVRGTLETIGMLAKKEEVKAPAIIVIGSVADLAMKQEMVRPLSGKRIGLTGTKHIVSKLKKECEADGAICYDLSYSHIHMFEPNEELKQALTHLLDYQWMVLTSTNAVHILFERMNAYQIDRRMLGHLKFAVIGEGTRETLAEYGYYADVMPSVYTTKALANKLVEVVKPGEKVLIPRAKNGSALLTKRLEEAHCSYSNIPLYELKNESMIRDSKLERVKSIDYITFASSEGVRGFFGGLSDRQRKELNGVTYACIGEVTLETLLTYTDGPYLVSESYTAEGLCKAILLNEKGQNKNE